MEVKFGAMHLEDVFQRS